MRRPPGPPPGESNRLWPDNWLGPMDLEPVWTQTGPRVLDLGCGKGRFLLAYAANHPGHRVLGVERKLRRIRKIDHKAWKAGLENVRLLRVEGNYALNHLIPPGWIDILFVFYPDPWPKARHEAHRIFSPAFLDTVDRALSAGGVVHFSTDHAPYFEQVKEILDADARWQPTKPHVPTEEETSDFELMFRDERPANRLAFRRNQ